MQYIVHTHVYFIYTHMNTHIYYLYHKHILEKTYKAGFQAVIQLKQLRHTRKPSGLRRSSSVFFGHSCNFLAVSEADHYWEWGNGFEADPTPSEAPSSARGVLRGGAGAVCWEQAVWGFFCQVSSALCVTRKG